MDPGDLRNVVNRGGGEERNKREGFGGRDRDRGNDSRDRGMGMGRDRGSSREGGSSGNANLIPIGPGRRGESTCHARVT